LGQLENGINPGIEIYEERGKTHNKIRKPMKILYQNLKLTQL
jgi:hypothetical protein